MSLQLNVQQQIEARKVEIRRTMRLASSNAVGLSWLVPLLESKLVPVANGALVQLNETPEQGGSLFCGIWLTEDREFWRFAVLASRSAGELLDIEEFSNITAAISTSGNLPGIGKSFGTVAIEVLSESSLG